MSALGADATITVPPLTTQEKLVVGEIRELLAELEEVGAERQVDLLYLTADILRQSVTERSLSLLVARDRYVQQLRRFKSAKLSTGERRVR